MNMKFKNLFTLFLLISTPWIVESRGVNGGWNCAVCTVVTGIIQQKAYLEEVSIYEAGLKFCKKLPPKLQHPCLSVFNELEPFLIDKRFLNIFTPDLFCYGVFACHVDPGEQFCHLFPAPHASFHKSVKHLRQAMKEYNVFHALNRLQLKPNPDSKSHEYTNRIQEITSFFHLSPDDNNDSSNYSRDVFPKVDFCKMPILNIICDVISNTFGNLQPAADLDNDGFSLLRIARGSDWRGKDCSDINPFVYPGAQIQNSDTNVDHNCNGIWGNDPESERPWEEVLCDDTKSQGIIYLGDSIGAHFHMPESWINPVLSSKSNIATIAEVLLDELDWPELGYFAGFMNSTYPDLINGTVDSIYLRLRNNNLCSHRDYQNSAKNAALAVDAVKQAKAISRQPSDKPALVIYALLANDVCNRFNDTIGNMTTPDQFERLVLETLNILNEKLPQNSNVVLLSLMDASFIYPAMAERVHPLGALFNNIHFKDLYAWYSCMQIGPCNGWMTPNETLRQITTKRAKDLSSVLKHISMNSKFDSFKLHYVKNPLDTVVKDWVAQGGKIYELIDPVDSTHPTQLAQPLMAATLWKSLLEIDVIGPPNPHNDKIKKLFGDQGGH